MMRVSLNYIIGISIFCLFFLTSKGLFAQQEILTTQWAYNKLTTNAGYTGGKDMLSIRALHRQQWVGLDGRPITSVFNIHAPLKKDRAAFGLSYIHDKLGIIKSNTLLGSFAYRISFENSTKLGLGVNFGFEHFYLNGNDLDLVQLNDPIRDQVTSRFNIKTGAGLYYYGDRFFVGVSTPNLIPNKIYTRSEGIQADPEESEQAIHLYLMAGYALELADGNFVIKPQALFKSVASRTKKAPWQLDFNLSFEIYDRFILGSTFRTTIANKNENNLQDHAAVDLMAGVWVTKQFLVSYAYDFTLGTLKNHNTGSHEIMLGFDMNFERSGTYTPRYF